MRTSSCGASRPGKKSPSRISRSPTMTGAIGRDCPLDPGRGQQQALRPGQGSQNPGRKHRADAGRGLSRQSFSFFASSFFTAFFVNSSARQRCFSFLETAPQRSQRKRPFFGLFSDFPFRQSLISVFSPLGFPGSRPIPKGPGSVKRFRSTLSLFPQRRFRPPMFFALRLRSREASRLRFSASSIRRCWLPAASSTLRGRRWL